MQITDLQIDKAYAYVRGSAKWPSLEGVHHHRPERVKVRHHDEDGKVNVVFTASEYNDSGVIGSIDPADVFLTWEDWKEHEYQRWDREAEERDQQRERDKVSEAFAHEVAERLREEGIDPVDIALVDGQYTMRLNALDLHDLLRNQR